MGEEIKKRKLDMVFFDMEGQIFEPGIHATKKGTAASVWSVVAKHLGPEAHAEEEATKEKWVAGKYRSYIDWMEDTLRIHKKYGLTESFFNEIIRNVKYVDGAKETVQELIRRGYSIAIISGGFKNIADRAIRDLGIHHVFAACEYFFDKKTGKLTSWNLLPCDYHGKVDFMKVLIREHGLRPEQCAFVGDGVNDIHLAKEVGLSIAFNAAPELQKVSTYSINQKEKDLREVLKYL